MVNNIGIWAFTPDRITSENLTDCDGLALEILKTGYRVKTTIENLVENIIIFFEDECFSNDEEFTIEGCMDFISNSGGFAEFDYYIA